MGYPTVAISVANAEHIHIKEKANEINNKSIFKALSDKSPDKKHITGPRERKNKNLS